MPESNQHFRDEIRQANAEEEAALLASIRATTSDEERRADWDAMRGARVREPKPSTNRWGDLLGELLAGFRVIQGRLVGLAAACAIVLAGALIWAFGSSQLAVLRPAGPQGNGQVASKISVGVRSQAVQLAVLGVILDGQLPRSGQRTAAGDAQVFDIDLLGTNQVGVAIRFTGRMWITNAPGVLKATKTAQVRGVYLDGQLQVPGSSTQTVQQVFLP